MRTLRPEPLTAAAFAPFGDVIELAGVKMEFFLKA
jgi:ureidoglycolate hydrolase